MTRAEHFSNELDYERPEDAAMRAHLGLRPIIYKAEDRTADPRPCPAWCWLAQSTEHAHEVECAHPMSATHTMEAVPAIVASQYVGNMLTGGPRLVEPAMLEPRPEQVGQGDPTIHIGLRHGHGKAHTYEDDRLVLSVEDAREMVTVLATSSRRPESADLAPKANALRTMCAEGVAAALSCAPWTRFCYCSPARSSGSPSTGSGILRRTRGRVVGRPGCGNARDARKPRASY